MMMMMMRGGVTRTGTINRRIIQVQCKRCFSQQASSLATANTVSANNTTTTTTSTSTSTSSTSIEFQHPKAQELFHKMTQLQRDELKIISDLINQKIGITITEADKLGRHGHGRGRGGHGGGSSTANSSNNNTDGTDGTDAEGSMKPKTHFDLKLISFDAKAKIKVIKEVRAITGLGLKEAKELVEGAPKLVKKDIQVEEAKALKKTLEDIGATIELD